MSMPPQPGLILADWQPNRVGQRQAIRAQSRAGKILAQQIERYLKGEVCGRSCLIAGSRGSGKTTIVQIACDAARDRVPGMRPILVRLHGPSLLNPSQRQPADSKTPDAKTPDPQTPEPSPQEKIYENVLRTIVINLYQTAAEEFATAYRKRARDHADEALERAAQLRLTLDGAPNAAALRNFWDAANALETGVLLEGSSRRDQGLREILALATAAEAYRSCTGEFTRKDEDIASAGHREEIKLEAEAKGKEIGQALVSVLSGLAVGGGSAASGASPIASALAGTITSVLSLATLSYTSSFSRETTVKQTVEFLPDLTTSALVHRLPLLLRRFRQAGIVPVFMIDELDKIDELSKPLNNLVSHLKFICADQAFFCFLTDRGYLGEVSQRNLESNTELLTVFTDTLFVLYETSSFREYLRQVIRPQTETSDVELGFDLEALQLVLIHRSQMLAFNLMREIADIVEPDGAEKRLSLLPGEPRKNPRYQMFLILQLAVEVILSDSLVAQRVQQDPDFGQILYDALYYPTKRWYQGKQDLDCSFDALMSGIAKMHAPTSFSKSVAPKDFLNPLGQDDKEFLHTQVRSLLELVCDPGALHQALAGGRIVNTVVADVLNYPPQLLTKVGEDKYKWKYNRFGIPFETAEIHDVVAEAQTAGAAADAVLDAVGKISVIASVADIVDSLAPAMEIVTTVDESLRELSVFLN